MSQLVAALVMTISALTQLPFTDACAGWLESRKPYLSQKTYHEYKLNLKTLGAFFGEFRLQEIDGDLVRAYQRTRMKKCGPFAINHECGVLCQIRKRIGMPLADYQPLPLPKAERGRVLTDEQRTRLLRLAASNENWEAAYLFASISVNTSAGPKETYTLRLKDVDLVAATIRVQPHGAKNVHRIRTIPLNEEALATAQLAIERAKRLGSVDPEHYVFPFRIHRAKFDPTRHQTTFKTAWKKLIEAAHLPGFRMYDLRHHAITALLENPEVSEETVEDIAGHVSRRMKKRYSHIRLEYKRAAVEALTRKKQRPQKAKTSKISTREELVELLGSVVDKLLEVRQ